MGGRFTEEGEVASGGGGRLAAHCVWQRRLARTRAGNGWSRWQRAWHRDGRVGGLAGLDGARYAVQSV